jgi:hypothetical protein
VFGLTLSGQEHIITKHYKRGVNGSMLSSRLLSDVFVSRVSQTIDYKRGVNGSMLSSRLLNDVL